MITWEVMTQKVIMQFLWLILYWHYNERLGTIQKGYGRRILGFLVSAGLLATSFLVWDWISWLLVTAFLLIFDLFFDEKPMRSQWFFILIPGLCMAAVMAAAEISPGKWQWISAVANGGVLFLMFLRIARVQSTKQSGIIGVKIPFDPNIMDIKTEMEKEIDI